jgi:hypothetical protein
MPTKVGTRSKGSIAVAVPQRTLASNSGPGRVRAD